MSQTMSVNAAASRPSSPDLFILLLTGLIWTYVWRVQDMFPLLAKVRFPLLLLLATVGVFMLDNDVRRRVATAKGPIMTMLMGLLAIMVIGVPLGVYPGRSFTFITKDFLPSVGVLVMIAASIRDRGDIEHYMRWTFYGALAYAMFVHFNFSVVSGGRLGDLVYYDANDFAMLLVCALPLGLFTARSQKGVIRLIAIAGIGLFVFMLMKSGSRGGLLGFIAVMLYVLLRYNAVPAKVRFGSVLGTVGFLILVGTDTYWQQMSTLLDPKNDYNLDENNEDGRMMVWKRGMGYMMKRPIVGVGPRNFPVAEGYLSEAGRANMREGGEGHKWSAPHNSFVEVGAETGIPGLLLFVSCIFTAIRLLLIVRRPVARGSPVEPWKSLASQSLNIVFVGYVVAGFFVGAAYFTFLYVMYALVIGLVKVTKLDAATPVRTLAPVGLPVGAVGPRMRGGLAMRAVR